MEKTNIFFSKYKLDVTDKKANILSRSLLWMSFGLAIIVLVAWISSINDAFLRFAYDMSYGNMWIVSWLINLVLLISLVFATSSNKVPLIVPIILYALFAFYEGFFITTILVFSGSVDIVKDLLLYMLIPAAIFLVMGILAYFNLVNFTKIIPFLMFGLIALMIMSIVLFVVNNYVVEMVYLLLAASIFIIWVGIDIQIIIRSQKQLDYVDTKSLNRMAILYGINLFIDFVRLLAIFMRIVRN